MADENSSTSKHVVKKSGYISGKLRYFSEENEHKPGIAKAMGDISLKDSIVEFLVVMLYGNGNNEDNKGFVSINFYCNVPKIFENHHTFYFSCVIAIEDVHAEKRFSRTFRFPYDPKTQSKNILTEFNVDRYIAHKIVLADKDLLHEDCLKLDIEVYFEAVIDNSITKIDEKIKMTDENPSTSKDIVEEDCSISGELRNFSDENEHKPGIAQALANFSLNNSIVEFLFVTFYGNGNNKDNKGFVSINFHCNMPIIFKSHHTFKFSCVIAIKDVHAEKRFARTFTFPYDPKAQSENILAEFNVDRYIAREIVLADKDLLIDDCLKFDIEAYFEAVVDDNITEIDKAFNSSFENAKFVDGSEKNILLLDSAVAARFYEVSSVFRALCDSPMLESSRGFFSLENEDSLSFKKACYMILGSKAVTFRTIEEIEDLYIFADKWHLQNVIKACHKFFTEILYIKSAWGTFIPLNERINKISALAMTFSDDILRETLDRFLRDEHNSDIDEHPKCKDSKVDLGSRKMTYNIPSPYLYFVVEEDEDIFNFDFYH